MFWTLQKDLKTIKKFLGVKNGSSKSSHDGNETWNNSDVPRTIEEHLILIQREPLHNKLILSKTLPEVASIKDLIRIFPKLLEDIFGFNEGSSHHSWQLGPMERSHGPHLFDDVREFVGPRGTLMEIAKLLLFEHEAYYMFPSHKLPGGSRRLIESGVLPAMYADRLDDNGLYLKLNSFEIYIFELIYAVVNNSTKHSKKWKTLEDFLYPQVMLDMLQYFLPCGEVLDKDIFLYPLVKRSTMDKGSYLAHSQHHRTVPTVFKTSFIQQQNKVISSYGLSSTGPDSELWMSKLFLKAVTDFFLNQNSFLYSGEMDIFSACKETFSPTANHMRLVNMFVQYIHCFVNSRLERHNETQTINPTSVSTINMLDQLKRSAIPQFIQKTLYVFLKHWFSRWPLESSFHLILEIWLNYIQPWKFFDFDSISREDGNSSGNNARITLTSHTEEWQQFVEGNILFYTVLLAAFLPRVFRMNLTTRTDSKMLHKVFKNLNSNDLSSMIIKAERKLQYQMVTNMTASVSDTESIYFLPRNIANLESANFNYFSFFGPQIQSSVYKVLKKVITAINENKSMSREANVEESDQTEHRVESWIDQMFGLFSSGEDSTQNKDCLLEVLENLCQLFHMPVPPGLEIIPERDLDLNDEKSLPDCQFTEYGPKLSSFGRYQILTKQKKFTSFNMGDPDLAPIRTCENAFLVRKLYKCSQFLNSLLREQIREYFHRQDFYGHLARVFIVPPVPEQYSRLRCPVNKRALQLTLCRRPRISLRVLANYYLIFAIVIFRMFLLFFLDFGSVLFFVCLLLLITLSTVILASFNFGRDYFEKKWTTEEE